MKNLIIALALLATVIPANASTIYCYTTEAGITKCSQNIPTHLLHPSKQDYVNKMWLEGLSDEDKQKVIKQGIQREYMVQFSSCKWQKCQHLGDPSSEKVRTCMDINAGICAAQYLEKCEKSAIKPQLDKEGRLIPKTSSQDIKETSNIEPKNTSNQDGIMDVLNNQYAPSTSDKKQGFCKELWKDLKHVVGN